MATDCQYDMNRLNHIGDDLIAAFNDGYKQGKADADRKQGKWIVMNDDYIDDCKCSECGCIEYFNKGWKRFNFCPNCGADMRGDSNE